MANRVTVWPETVSPATCARSGPSAYRFAPVAFTEPNASRPPGVAGRGLAPPPVNRLAAGKSLRSLKSYSAAQNWRSGSRLLWQPTHSLPATEWLLSRPTVLSGVMLFALENDWPSATSSVWFAVTRCWLLSLVFHSARYAGVV